ncbi:MAG: hypothetical protein INH41_11860 [Myxococcaceae bacterium]|nr:hypothetical protein [Myxococcaceae bacterium]MCA3013079.1 hypothetical protein [Myxococcaceae bacterium]
MLRVAWVLLALSCTSGCVRRVASLPPDAASLPPPPEGTVDVLVLPDEAAPEWVASTGAAQCRAPCTLRLEPGAPLRASSSSGDEAELGALPADVVLARRAVLVPQPASAGLLVNGLVFTSLGGAACIVAITLIGAGCGNPMQPSGLCTAGLVTAAAGVPVTGAAILMLVGSAPQLQLLPVTGTGRGGVSVAVTPVGLVGRF